MEFKQGLVSVLITNYNNASYLEDCIKSLVQQSYKKIEVIIVDDGSEDDSKEIIFKLNENYGSFFANFKTIFLKENLGINGALNRGILHVDGAMTLILDADDMLSPQYIEKLVFHLLTGEKNLGFVYSDCALINGNSDVIGRGISHAFSPNLLQTQSYIPGCGLSLTRALLCAFPVDENIKVATKVYRWRDIVKKGFVGKYLPEALFFYRMHENNISGIGKKVLSEINESPKPVLKILSGYWQSEDKL